ncbi:MAG: BatA domain-containing protein [Bacteroidetes bacterium]|nr:BatA domain-containing protein [Bacteroidota bacterium]
MLRFQHIEYLWFLLVIPLMIVIYIVWLKQRQAKLLKIGDLQLVNELLPTYSQRRNTIKFTLLVLALFFGDFISESAIRCSF